MNILKRYTYIYTKKKLKHPHAFFEMTNDTTKHVHFKYWPSQFKKHDKIVISLWKRHLWITWRHLFFKVQYRVQPPRAGMTASTLRLIPPVRRRMSCCDSCCHSRCNDASNWRMFCTGGSRACIRRPNMSQICSMGFKSGLMAGQGTEVTASLWK
jgi:hypothetical protein